MINDMHDCIILLSTSAVSEKAYIRNTEIDGKSWQDRFQDEEAADD